jgi:hypothetical protein
MKSARKPSAFFIYGPAGIGKTSLAGSFPDPWFICDRMEDGVDDLVQANMISVKGVELAQTFEEFVSMLKAAKDRECRTVVIETLAGWEAMMHEEEYKTGKNRANKPYTSRADFEGFNYGYKACSHRVLDVVSALQDLRAAGKTVVMTGHADPTRMEKNPEGNDFSKTYPVVKGLKETWHPLARWFPNVLYMTLDFVVEESESLAVKPKASSCGDHVLRTHVSINYEAKNRLSLPESIDCGATGAEAFANLTAAIKEARS